MIDASQVDAHAALTRLRAFARLTRLEIASLRPMCAAPKLLKKGAIVQKQGERATGIWLLLDGWSASSIIMPDGERAILNVQMPGDLIGLPGISLAAASDTVTALTDVAIGEMPLSELGRLFREEPRIAALLFLISQEERVMLMDRLALTGRRNALGRVAGMVLQLQDRLSRDNSSMSNTMEIPLTQADMADMVGLTAVHMNRSLREFHRRGVLTASTRQIIIHDMRELRRFAGLPARPLEREQDWLPDAVG